MKSVNILVENKAVSLERDHALIIIRGVVCIDNQLWRSNDLIHNALSRTHIKAA